MSVAGDMEAGRAALERGDWTAARDAFLREIERAESAEALEGLGTALWWQDDQQAVLDARENAFRLYRAAGDLRGAARIATALAVDYADYRNDLAVCSGWLQRAERLLSDMETAPEHGWFHLFHGYVSLMFENDIDAAREHLRGAVTIAEQITVIDIEMMTVALEGLILIREGKVPDGMRRLDEAMTAAVGGEMSDLAAIGMTCCSLIYACEAVADYDRAAQWCDRAREFCRRLGLDLFFAICRNYYATVLIWKGAWAEAETELAAAMRAMEPTRPNYVRESLAKLGELRRRQGRNDEAEELLVRAEPHTLSLIGRGALALDRGDAAAAADFAQRALRRVGAEDHAERVFAIEILLRARLLENDTARATRALGELRTAAQLAGTPALLANASAAEGAIALTDGRPADAIGPLEDALDLFEETEAAFEASRVRLDLALARRSLGRRADALEQAMLAQSTFRRLGAAFYAEQATALCAELGSEIGAPPANGALPHNLTPREAEVLWLIAAGKTNQDIATELVLSVRTVERHISTIYEKLALHGRAARASAAAFAANLRANT